MKTYFIILAIFFFVFGVFHLALGIITIIKSKQEIKRKKNQH